MKQETFKAFVNTLDKKEVAELVSAVVDRYSKEDSDPCRVIFEQEERMIIVDRFESNNQRPREPYALMGGSNFR